MNLVINPMNGKHKRRTTLVRLVGICCVFIAQQAADRICGMLRTCTTVRFVVDLL